jgi:hypothetical protein
MAHGVKADKMSALQSRALLHAEPLRCRNHHAHVLRPQKNADLIVAAVCDRRISSRSRPGGARQAPLQGFCRGLVRAVFPASPQGEFPRHWVCRLARCPRIRCAC